MVKALSSISLSCQPPFPPLTHSTRTSSSASTLPLPSARRVETDQSRSQPSSCEVEVRSFIGHNGQVSGLSSFSGARA